MKSTLITTVIACACCAPLSLAQDHHPDQSHAHEHKPVNTMCPIGQEPIVESVPTLEYKGQTIGFCCPGCDKEFMGWDEAKRDAFVASAKAGHDVHAGHAAAAPAPKTVASQPYTLDTCPVSGEKLGSMGDPIVKEIDGREVRFCCSMCSPRFEKNKAQFFKKIDEQMIADQLPHYPLTTCVVSGEQLSEEGEHAAINIIYKNRLVRFCCNMCQDDFNENPAKFIAKLDKTAADQQRASYPLDTCMVSGEELGGMGEPTEIVLAGRLIRFCCASCEPKVKADPAKFIAEIDKAWQVQGKFKPTAKPEGEPGEPGGHGDHDHGG